MFQTASLFSHSCDPNLREDVFENPVQDTNGVVRNEAYLRLTAQRTIQPGELLTITYNIWTGPAYEERQKLIKEVWYFDCCCELCLSQKPKNE